MTTMEVHEPVSVLELVDQLEDVVTAARRLPLSANVVVNEDETLELVDRIIVLTAVTTRGVGGGAHASSC